MQSTSIIWESFYTLYELLFYGASVLIDTFFTDIRTVVMNFAGNGLMNNVLQTILNISLPIGFGETVVLGDISLASFMLGLGIPFIVVYSVAKWFLDIIS